MLRVSRVFLFMIPAALVVAAIPTTARAEDEAPESVPTVDSDYEKVAIKQAEELPDGQRSEQSIRALREKLASIQ